MSSDAERFAAIERAVIAQGARLAALEFWARRLILARVDGALADDPALTRKRAIRMLFSAEFLASADAEFRAMHKAFGDFEAQAALGAMLTLLEQCETLMTAADAGGRPED